MFEIRHALLYSSCIHVCGITRSRRHKDVSSSGVTYKGMVNIVYSTQHAYVFL